MSTAREAVIRPPDLGWLGWLLVALVLFPPVLVLVMTMLAPSRVPGGVDQRPYQHCGGVRASATPMHTAQCRWCELWFTPDGLQVHRDRLLCTCLDQVRLEAAVNSTATTSDTPAASGAGPSAPHGLSDDGGMADIESTGNQPLHSDVPQPDADRTLANVVTGFLYQNLTRGSCQKRFVCSMYCAPGLGVHTRLCGGRAAAVDVQPRAHKVAYAAWADNNNKSPRLPTGMPPTPASPPLVTPAIPATCTP
jgi:hypothetical protein